MSFALLPHSIYALPDLKETLQTSKTLMKYKYISQSEGLTGESIQ